MHSSANRKDAIRKYKERKPQVGAFAVRCTASGRTWVGVSQNLDTVKNGFWFGLRQGSHPYKSLQEEWNTYGEDAFQYEILEKLEELPEFGLKDVLKEKKAGWMARLGAGAL